MDIRQITPDYAVSPQIAPGDMAAIVAAGFTTIIDNRPDAEISADLRTPQMEAAAQAAGLGFIALPVTHQGLNADMVHAQSEAAAGGKTLAYCASGTRSTIVWALGQVGKMPGDEIVAKAAAAGYDISGLRPQLG